MTASGRTQTTVPAGGRSAQSDAASARPWPRPLKLLMVTVGLGVGGTEGQISEIAARLDPRRFTVCVCALKGEDILARELRERGSASSRWAVRLGSTSASSGDSLASFAKFART